MLSKNNGQEQIRKQESKKQRFAIKKLTVGVASVLVGFTFMGLNASASADDTPTQPAKNDDNNVSSDTTNELQQSNVSLTTTEATDTAVKNNVPRTTDNSVDKASNVEANSASQKYEQSIAEKMELYKTSLVAVNNPNGDSQETNAPQQTTTLTSAPLYTTQGQVPTLDMNNMFTQEQLSQYGDNPQIDWVTKPDVTNIGNVTGTAKLTYEDMNADPTEDGTIPIKETMVNVPVLVRKAEQEVAANQVKNSLDVINSSNNSLVAHYEWVGEKAANDEDEGVSIPGRDAFESNFMTIIEKLGFESDDYSEFPEDLMTFGTKNKSVTMFVHPVSTDPVIADDPYFNADGNSSIDNVNETPDPANYIGNLGTLPEGTKIEWNDVPTYDYTKDEDGNYTNPEPTNSPSIKVTIPGKNPIILDSDPNGDPLKEIATLPAYGDGTLLLNSNNELELGSSAKTPINYVANFDSFSKKYLEDSDKEANADNVQDLKDSFKWTIAPNTQQAGYTFGVFKYGDGNVGNLILFKVNSTEDVTKTDADAKSTVTETINVTTPDGKTTPVVNSVTFNRTATKDLVTGKVSYGAWSDNGTYTFSSYTAPEEPGYTPSQNEVPAQTVKPGDKNLVFNITYSAIEQTRKIVFVDNGNTVGTQPLTGKTGTSVTIGNRDGETPLKVPTGYEVVPGTEIPTTVGFNANNNPDITVQVRQKIDTDDGRNDKGNKDIYREVTRTITVNIEGKAPQTGTQKLYFYRIKSTNEATGKVTYTDWTSNMTDGATSFSDFGIPDAAGYTRTITGGTITTKDGKDYVAAQSGLENGEPVNNIIVTVDYSKADQTATIKYVNNADHNDVVGTQVVGGKIGETKQVTLEVPANWKVIGGQNIPSSFTFGSTPIKDTIVYVEHGTKDVTNDPSQADKVNKTITRTIDLDIAGKTSEYTKQTVTIHRSATEDLVTKEVTYGAWNVDEAKFDAVTAPEEPGYTVSNPDVAPEVAITGETEDSTVTFVYGADQHSQVINYVDKDGKVINTYNVTGKTGETVQTNVEKNVPKNWVIVGGQEITTSVTFGSDNPAPINVTIEHGTEDVTKTDAGAKSTVTETINVTTPDGKTTPVVNSVTFNRTATKDLVTGEVTYGVWSDNGTYTFSSYTVPTVAGYTPSQNEVPAQTVKPGDKDLIFDITYSTNDQTRKIVFVDNGNTVGTQTLTGKTGTSVTIGNGNGETPLQVPTGYEVVPNTEIPTTVGFNAIDNPDITVQVQAKKDTDDGRNDKGNKDVYREVTRTITVNIEDQAPQTRTQTLAFYRIKTTNEATGKTSYTAWTSNMTDDSTSFPEVEIPSAAGYTRTITGGTITTKDGKDYVAAQSGLENGEPVNNITVTVDYEKADHTQVINYVDKAGKVISHYNVNGKTGESVNTDIANHVPEGWVISGKYPTSITFGSENPAPINVTIEHGTKDVTNDPSQADKVNKTITRTVDKNVAGKVTKVASQSVTLHRSATEDLVTGEITYGDWNTAKFDAVIAPEVAGYTVTNPNVAPAMDVTGETEDSTVTFTYTANEHSVTITYVDKNGKKVGGYTETGVTGETVDPEINAHVPNGYHVVDKYPTSITFGSSDPAPITVHVEENVNPTDTDKNTPEPKDIHTTVGEEPSPEEGIGNIPSLPGGTSYTWTNGAPDVSTPGTKDVQITVTYPDGSTDVVTTKVIVSEPAKNPTVVDDKTTTPENGNNGKGNVINNDNQGNNNQGNVENTGSAVQPSANKTTPTNNTENTKTLPQTGNDANKTTSLVGLGLASFAAMFGLGKKKRQD